MKKHITLGKPRGGGGKVGPLRKIKDILLKTTYQNINTGNVGKVVDF